MAWIESHDELPTHPKVRSLSRKLGVSVPTVIGHLHVLWYWCLTHRPDGELSDMDADGVADAAGWEGEGETFVKAMLLAGWLDDNGGILVVHDWWDGAGKTIKRRTFATERQRNARDKQKDNDGVTDESHDSHADVTRDTSVSHGADSDSDSDKNLNPASTGVDNRFEEFWKAYPKRDGIKRGKKQAKAKWTKLSEADQASSMRALPNFQAAIDNPAVFCPIPDAVRWLANREFDDFQEAAVPSREQRRLRSIGTGGVA